MTFRTPGRLAIHRRSDEIAFLQHRLRVIDDSRIAHKYGEQEDLKPTLQERYQNTTSGKEDELKLEILMRERDLADELLHTRQIEPLGETLQRRLAMAERICRDLALPTEPPLQRSDLADGQRPDQGSDRLNQARYRDRGPGAYRVAKIEHQALTEMLNQWWAWLRKSS
jgi:hypothetical protein